MEEKKLKLYASDDALYYRSYYAYGLASEASDEEILAQPRVVELLDRLEWSTLRLDEMGNHLVYTEGLVRAINDCKEVLRRAGRLGGVTPPTPEPAPAGPPSGRSAGG